MIDFLWPFYPLRWRELMKELKRQGCFDRQAVKRMNFDFLYSYTFSVGAMAVAILFSKMPSLYALCWAVGGYIAFGLSYKADNFKRFYLYNRAQKRTAKIVTPIKENWYPLGGYVYFFDYEYPILKGVQKSRCMYRKRDANSENFYSAFYEGAEILILVDEENERLSIVPMRNLQRIYKIDVCTSLENGKI